MLTDDGWFATGDIGEIDADGFLKITDRKKDLFKTSGGKYVAPSHIEGMFKGVCPLASQMVVHGSEPQLLHGAGHPRPGRRRRMGRSTTAWPASRTRRWSTSDAMYARRLRLRRRSSTADCNRWETIKKFKILGHDLSVESGEITPSLKVKRRVVESNYRDILDGFYS
ncbi:MAG: hypothetical protein WKF83_12650 [Nocardioidaceae bacterium]